MATLIIDMPRRYEDGEIYLGHLRVPKEAVPAFVIVPMHMLVGVAFGNQVRLVQRPVDFSLPFVFSQHHGKIRSLGLVQIDHSTAVAQVDSTAPVGTTGWVVGQRFITDDAIKAVFE